MYFILKFNLTFFSKFEETWELVFNFLNEIISKAIQNFASVISFLFFNRIVRSRLPSRVRSQSKLIGLFFMRRDSKVLTAAIFKVGSDFYRVWLLSLFFVVDVVVDRRRPANEWFKGAARYPTPTPPWPFAASMAMTFLSCFSFFLLECLINKRGLLEQRNPAGISQFPHWICNDQWL